jgi:PAS domain S-box-containing protein
MAGYVGLLSEDGAESRIVYMDTGDRDCKVAPDLPMPRRGLRDAACRTGEAVYENDFAKSQWTHLLPEGHAGIDNVLLAPLLLDGEAAGLLGLANKPGGFTRHDAELATGFAELAAIALRNARVAEGLERSQQRFRRLAQTASDGIVCADANGGIFLWNDAATTIFGHSAEEVSGRPIGLIAAKASAKALSLALDAAAARQELNAPLHALEIVGLRKDGGELPVELSVACWQAGGETFYTLIARDITERKQIERDLLEARDGLDARVKERTAELRQTVRELMNEITERKHAERTLARERRRLTSVLQMLPGYVCLLDQDRRVRFVNDKFLELFGDPADRRCHEVMRQQGHPCHACPVDGILARRAPAQWQWTDSEGRDYQVSGYPFSDVDGTRTVLALGIDVTERKRLEAEILRVSETERQRIGQDLHDSLGQILSGISCLSHVLRSKLQTRSMPEAEQAGQIEALVTESVQLTRSLARGLTPVGHGPERLRVAMKDLAASIETLFGIRCHFDCPAPVFIDDGMTATHIYRIAQEAANNAARHGMAKNVTISMTRQDGHLVMSVEDDGVGLPPRGVSADGMGLRIMEHRAHTIGATLRIYSREGGGTTVTCRL